MSEGLLRGEIYQLFMAQKSFHGKGVLKLDLE